MTAVDARAAVRAGVIAVVLSLTNFVAVFDGLGVAVALPAIQADFGLTPLDGQWVLTAYAVALGGALLTGGRCGDAFGRRRMLVAGLVVFAAGLLLAGFARDAWVLFAARAVQGAGAAFAVPNAFATISSLRPEAVRGRVFAAVAVAGGLGVAAGAIAGGLITQGLGWRFLFLLTAPVVAAVAVTARRVLDEDRRPDAPRPRPLGTLVAITATALLVYAITSHEPVAFAAVLLVLAVKPILPSRLLREKSLRAAIAGLPGFVFAYDGTVFAGLLFLQRELTPLQAGLTFTPLGVAVLFGAPLAARLLHRREWTNVFAAAQVVCAAGLVLLALGYVLPGLVLVGLGAAVSAVTLNGAAGRHVPPEDRGSAYGCYETAKYLCGALVVAVLATTLTHSYQLAFLVAAAVALLGGLAGSLLGRPS
ncbi:DHA2 family efflux MFS transporter permease subunit [Amycolatopsis endophytica]|uniref:MFS family permease n=1 Tax=Amycolatopsis endophytica TaxID=860233 RepID=A0A853BF17_9PSEU|nr:MFS transporter [Amycolatopsis endophytica]NYI93344.1 MFS family permease [Amycolatopsis endophytica]